MARAGIPYPWTRRGRERLVDVNTTHGARTTPFFVTRNERALSQERPEAFRFYRLYDLARSPRLFKLRPPLEQSVMLEPESWRAGFGRGSGLKNNRVLN